VWDATAPRQWKARDGATCDVVVERGRGKAEAFAALGRNEQPPFRYIADVLIYAVKVEDRGKPDPARKAVQDLADPPITVRMQLSSPMADLYFWSKSSGWVKAELFVAGNRYDPDTVIADYQKKGATVSFRVVRWHPEDTDTADG
jgi:hypothetical protein